MILNTKQFAALIGCHPNTLLKIRHTPGFPKPVKLFKRRLIWAKSDIDAYLGL